MRLLPVWVPILALSCGGAPPRDTAPATFEALSAAELVLPASSKYSEVRLAVSPDGDTMLWGSTDRPGGPGGRDIWISRRTAGGWSDPEPVSFNTAAKEYDPAYSPDGRLVYFFSDRPGGLGEDDIYRVAVTADGFGPARHLGPEVNSAGDEWAPAILADGALLFASDGRGGRGGHDRFIAAARGAGFAAAASAPGAINSAHDEFDATPLPGGDLIFSRSIDLEDQPVFLVLARRTADGFEAGTPLPGSVNVDGGVTFGPTVNGSDPSVLYFTGDRPGRALGKYDIYRIRFRVGS
jgi:hypothetical protein